MDAFAPVSGEVKLLDVLDAEIARRSARFTTVEVIPYRPTSNIPDAQLTPPGTIGVFAAKRGSAVLRQLVAAAQEGKGADRRLARAIVRKMMGRKRVSLEEATARAINQPVLAQLNYGGATMVRDIFVEDADDLFFTILPWAGGALTPKGFRFDEFVFEDEDEDLDCVLLANPPILTAAEKAALAKVPAEMAHVMVSPAARAAVPGLTIALGLHVLVWGFVYATYTLAKAHNDHSMEHINPAVLENLSPVATARALLKLRVDVLAGRLGAVQVAAEKVAQQAAQGRV